MTNGSGPLCLAASSLVDRRLTGAQLLPVDLEGEVGEVGQAVPEVEQLTGGEIVLTQLSLVARVLHSHWSRIIEALLSLVDIMMLLCQLSFAIKTQLNGSFHAWEGSIIGALMP